MKRRNDKAKTGGGKRMPLTLWISIGAVLLCAVTAACHKK